VAGGRTSNSYILLTSRTGTVAAIVEVDASNGLRVRIRDGGGRFLRLDPPLSGGLISDADQFGMGGDGSLYVPLAETVEIDTGVDRAPRLEVQHLRVHLRAPGAGWTRLDDIARLADRARAILPTDEQAAFDLATSRLVPVAVLRADEARVLVLWRRNKVLEGALGTPAGFEPPFVVAGDTSFKEVDDIAAADGRLVVVARSGGRGGRVFQLWEGPVAGPLVMSHMPDGVATVGVSDRAVLAALSLSGRKLVIHTRPPAAGWLRRTGRLSSAHTVVGHEDSIDSSGTRTVTAVSEPIGRARTTQLFDVREACPATLPAGLACPDAGATLGVVRGPVWLQNPDLTDDFTDSPPLVRLLDGDAVLTAWAAQRMTGATRTEDVILAAYEPHAVPTVRALSFTVTLGLRLCATPGMRRCARKAVARLRLNSNARVMLHAGAQIGVLGFAETFVRAGRVATFRFVLPAGRHTISPIVATLERPPRKVVVVG
jgi:hypothetical protein